MECFPELTYAIFVDGELSAEESQRVQAHLSTCARCREMVTALIAENKMLAVTLAEAHGKESTPALAARPAWMELLGVVVVLAMAGVVTHWLSRQGLPGSSWLNPFSSDGRNNLAFNLVFYLSHGGAAVLEHLASMVGWVLLMIATAAGLFALARYQHRFRSGFLLAALALAFCLPGRAIETRHSRTVLTIPQNETVNDTLFAAGETVEIDGVVKGDLFTAARSVEVHGTVTGNIFSWSKDVQVDGTVGGSILGFAQNLTVRGQVGHSVYAWAEFLHLEPGSHVGSDVIAGTQQSDLQGKIDGGLMAFAGLVNVHGDIGRNIIAYVHELNLNSPTHVGGGLTARVHHRKDVRISDGVTVGGPVNISLISHASRYTRPKFYIWRAIGLAGGFIVGWILMYLFPSFFAATSHAVAAGWRTFGLGFAVLVGTPIAIILVALSLIGLPLALISLGLYLIGLYLAVVFTAAFIGSLIFTSTQPRSGRALLAYFVGLLILTVIFALPFIGSILKFLAFCLGLGALMLQLHRSWRPAPA